MKYLVSKEEMESYDNNTTAYFQIPSLVLMERAALFVYEYIRKNYSISSKILLVCGMGNNGADAMALARMLYLGKYSVTVLIVGNKENFSVSALKQYEILQKYDIPLEDVLPEKEYDIIVDGLFGIGLSRDITGDYEQLISGLNNQNAIKIALDIPSGVDASNGTIKNCAIIADITITFGYIKKGMMLYPGKTLCGKIITADIGINEHSFMGQYPVAFTYDNLDLSLLPKRSSYGNKGDFGKALIIAGSYQMAGACEIAAKACYRMGAGMVKVVTSTKNRLIIQTNLPEALLSCYDTDRDFSDFADILEEDLKWCNCVCMGPGLGKDRYAKQLISFLFERTPPQIPFIIDADAINIISESDNLRGKLRENNTREIIMTPHIGELSRFTGLPVEMLKTDLEKILKQTVENYPIVLVAKDAVTMVYDKKNKLYINCSGNEGMATAGMGDALSGIITALIAQGADSYLAASLGVYIHGLCGDLAKEEMGSYSLMASDVIKQLKNLFKGGFLND